MTSKNQYHSASTRRLQQKQRRRKLNNKPPNNIKNLKSASAVLFLVLVAGSVLSLIWLKNAENSAFKAWASLETEFQGQPFRTKATRDTRNFSVSTTQNASILSAEKEISEWLQPRSTATANTTTEGQVKFYAVHIGPSKTGTSAIQVDSRDNPWDGNTGAEDKDNFIYVGKVYSRDMKAQGKNTTIRYVNGAYTTSKDEIKAYQEARGCMWNILEIYYNSTNDDMEAVDERLERNETERASLKKQFIEECWRGHEYMLDYSLLDSEEGYSYKPSQWSGKRDAERQGGVVKGYMKLGRQFRAFDILGYNRLIVVGAYRRYAEWILSVYTQDIKDYCLRRKLELQGKSCDTLENFLAKILRRGNRFNARFYHNLHLTLPQIAKDSPSKLETKILNYFVQPHETKQTTSEDAVKKYSSITTELFCDALGEELTPYTCNHFRALEKKKEDSSQNKGSTSAMAYQSVVATGYDLKYLDVDTTNKVNSTILSPNIKTHVDLSDYHSKVLGLSWTDTMPTRCLGEEDLKKLLEISLEFEEIVLPDFYATQLGKEEHERLFWDVWLKERKLFCWVDLEKLFRNTTSWDEILNERIVSYNWSSLPH